MHPAPPISETLTRTDHPGQRHARPGTPPPLPAGATLGRYVVMHVLGEGGMGAVYAAHDFVLDRRVAVKLVHPDFNPAEREARKARLVAEAQAVARLSHPNVIAVYDVGEFCGELYIAMELVEGQTLQQWLGGGRRSLPEILDVFAQAGRGLAAAHRAGLVHRDFKPHNVLVGADGRVRVTDFGLAVSLGTPAGDGAGTPAYMAPEQARGQGSPRADQYSFAVALHEAVLGARPGEPGGRGPMPRWLRRVLERSLLPAEQRFPSMDEVLAALERGGGSRLRSRWQAFAGLGTGLAAGAAIAAALLTPRALPTSGAAERPEVAAAPGTKRPAANRPGPRARMERQALAIASEGAPEAAAPAAPAFTSGAPALAAQASAAPAAQRREIAPSPALERREQPSFLAALQRLLRALQDMGLLTEDDIIVGPPKPPPPPPPLAAAPSDEDGLEGGEGSVWVPVSWIGRSGTHPSLAVATAPTRVSDLEHVVARAEDPVELAEARFALAQALWDSNQDRDRALRLAQQAQAALQSDGQDASPELLNKITEWIELRQLYQQ